MAWIGAGRRQVCTSRGPGCRPWRRGSIRTQSSNADHDEPGIAGRVRVLIASPLPPPVGGISTWTEEVRASRLPRSFAVEIFDTSWREDGVRPRSRWRADRAWRSIGQLVRYQRAVRTFRPRIVHVSSSYHWGFVRDAATIALARVAGARVVLQLHGGDFPEFRARLGRFGSGLVDRVLRACDRVLVLESKSERALAAIVGPGRVCRTINATEVPSERPEPARGAEAPCQILYAGAILEAKGILDLLAAFDGVRDASLTLVGPIDPGFAPKLHGAAAVASGRVRVLPERPRRQILELLREADIVVIPSHREGLPLALIEAMAAGRAIIATAVGAIPEIVRDREEARLVPAHDPSALRRALQDLVDAPAERDALGTRAHACAKECFSRESLEQQLGTIWRELASDGAAR